MKMSGRRESSNVQDRRGVSTSTKAAGGIGGLGVIGVIIYFVLSGGNVSPEVVSQLSGGTNTAQTTQTTKTTTDSAYYKNNADFANEDELFKFTSQVLASTEDAWTKLFQKEGKTYVPPKMTVFSEQTDSGCGRAQANMGPFYCPVDQTVYLDLQFLTTMKKTLGADGDFAFAYVIAHEVGHHIQYLTGELAKYQTMEQQLKKTGKTAESNLVSVQIELEADCYAGVWGNVENNVYKSLESADFMEAFQAAKAVGDDTLGNTRRDTFSHGSAKMRQKWFTNGFKAGDRKACDTYGFGSLNELEK